MQNKTDNMLFDFSFPAEISAWRDLRSRIKVILQQSFNELSFTRLQKAETGWFADSDPYITDWPSTDRQQKINDILLVISEAVQNIIRHGFTATQTSGHIRLCGRIDGYRLYIIITDDAPLMDLASIQHRPLDEIREGGLGTYFITTLSQNAVWSHADDHNRLDLTFTLGPKAD